MYNSLNIRNSHLTDAIQRNLRSGLDLHNAVETAIHSPAPRYYVDPTLAERYISLMLNNKPIPVTTNPRLAQWQEIAAKVKQAMATRHRLSWQHHLMHILDTEPASSFFIGARQALAIYHETRRLRALTK